MPHKYNYLNSPFIPCMRTCLFFLTVLFFCRCNSNNPQEEPFASMLKNCDQVNIVFYNSADSLNYHTTDSTGIKILARMVSGKKETVSDTCRPVGKLTYLAKGQPLYEAQFALSSTKGALSCNYITYVFNQQTYKHRLTERAENILRQVNTVNNKTPS